MDRRHTPNRFMCWSPFWAPYNLSANTWAIILYIYVHLIDNIVVEESAINEHTMIVNSRESTDGISIDWSDSLVYMCVYVTASTEGCVLHSLQIMQIIIFIIQLEVSLDTADTLHYVFLLMPSYGSVMFLFCSCLRGVGDSPLHYVIIPNNQSLRPKTVYESATVFTGFL